VVYGPRDRALLPVYKAARLGVVPVYGDGLNQLSWLHVFDAADAIVEATLADGPSGAIYSLSDGQPHTWRELLEAFGEAIGRRPRIVPVPPVLYEALGLGVCYAAYGVSKLLKKTPYMSRKEIEHLRLRYWVCDNEAISRDLAWKPAWDIERGLRQTLAWYRERGWL
jgi:nucleoside-diphosphate-sugar epimerase